VEAFSAASSTSRVGRCPTLVQWRRCSDSPTPECRQQLNRLPRPSGARVNGAASGEARASAMASDDDDEEEEMPTYHNTCVRTLHARAHVHCRRTDPPHCRVRVRRACEDPVHRSRVI
jgi:hypothetical protein